MTRRYATGSVFRQANGRWVAQWELPPVNGRRRRRQLLAESEAGAWKRLGESTGSLRPTGTLGAFLDAWLRDVVTHTRRERTLVGYRAIVERVKDVIGDVPVAQLERPGDDTIQVLINALPLAPRTKRHYAACLRASFAYGVRKGKLVRNPAVELDLPRVKVQAIAPLTPDEIRALLSVDDPHRTLYRLAVRSGMRQGELLGLRWQDVDLARRSVHVEQTLVRLPGGRYVPEEPKTERSRRTIPIPREVGDDLRKLRESQMVDTKRLEQGLVFTRPGGSPLDAADVTRQFQATLRAAGVRQVRFHDLRHTAASLWIAEGVDLKTVSELLGHSTIATTADVYGHLTEGHKRAAVDRMDGVLA